MDIKPNHLANLAVVFVSIVFALALGEAGVRLLIEPPLYSRYAPESDQGTIDSQRIPDGGFYEDTPLGKRLKVNANGFVRNHYLTGTDIPLRTNQFGFRGPAVEFDNRLRVLFLGDSITLADYLVEEDTFVHMVGEMSGTSETPMQTINAGVGSIGIEEYYNILQETGYRVQPHVVVLNLYLNDVEASPALHLAPIPRGLRWSHIAQHVYQSLSVKRFEEKQSQDTGWIPRHVEDNWKHQAASRYPPGPGNWQTDRPAYNQMMVDWFGDWGSSYSDGGQERILRFAQKIFDSSKSLRAQPVVVIHPTRFQVEAEFNPDEPQQAFIAYMNNVGIPVHDLLPSMRSRYADTGRTLFYDHCHHTVEGSALVAREIFTFLQQSIPQDTAG